MGSLQRKDVGTELKVIYRTEKQLLDNEKQKHRNKKRQGCTETELERGARRNRRCASSLSAALISKAAFIMRKHSQKRKQRKAQTKQKTLQLAHLANSFFEAGIQGRLGEVYPEASSDLSNVQGWSVRAVSSVSSPSESSKYDTDPIPASPASSSFAASFPHGADPSVWDCYEL